MQWRGSVTCSSLHATRECVSSCTAVFQCIPSDFSDASCLLSSAQRVCCVDILVGQATVICWSRTRSQSDVRPGSRQGQTREASPPSNTKTTHQTATIPSPPPSPTAPAVSLAPSARPAASCTQPRAPAPPRNPPDDCWLRTRPHDATLHPHRLRPPPAAHFRGA